MAIRQPHAVADEPVRSRYHGQRMSLEQFLALPEEKPYLEYVDGVVLQKPMVNKRHSNLAGELTGQFWAYARVSGGSFGPERTVQLSRARYRLPDTAYWAPDRPNDENDLPTVAVEVRSPSETMVSLRAKCRMYREAGVPVAWLVDPATRTVEVFEGGRDGAILHEGDTLETPEMPGFALALSELFAVLDR